MQKSKRGKERRGRARVGRGNWEEIRRQEGEVVQGEELAPGVEMVKIPSHKAGGEKAVSGLSYSGLLFICSRCFLTRFRGAFHFPITFNT